MRDTDRPHPRPGASLRWIGHLLGLAYLLVTLLFGPIKSLAAWLAKQRWIQRYRGWVARLPPAAGLALSLLSLALLELSKIAVLLSYRVFGLPGALAATVCAKISIGYFAHATWQAARPEAVAAYSWVARVDAWVAAQLGQLRGLRDRWLRWLRGRPRYAVTAAVLRGLRRRVARLSEWIKLKLTAASS